MHCKNCYWWKRLKAVNLLIFDRGYCYCREIATRENFFVKITEIKIKYDSARINRCLE